MNFKVGSPQNGGPIFVRPARADDMLSVQGIYAYYVLETAISFETMPPPLDEMMARRDKVLADGLPYLVAERDNAVVGYCYATPYRPRQAYRFTVEESVYVAPSARGSGVGRILMLALIDLCAGLGKQQMLGVVTCDDQVNPSLDFHIRMGFQEVGRLTRVGFKNDKWYDTVFMQRALLP